MGGWVGGRPEVQGCSSSLCCLWLMLRVAGWGPGWAHLMQCMLTCTPERGVKGGISGALGPGAESSCPAANAKGHALDCLPSPGRAGGAAPAGARAPRGSGGGRARGCGLLRGGAGDGGVPGAAGRHPARRGGGAAGGAAAAGVGAGGTRRGAGGNCAGVWVVRGGGG